jgi:hypothetical protein
MIPGHNSAVTVRYDGRGYWLDIDSLRLDQRFPQACLCSLAAPLPPFQPQRSIAYMHEGLCVWVVSSLAYLRFMQIPCRCRRH